MFASPAPNISDWINVLNYGVDNTGGSDVIAAAQEAYNAANTAGGGMVYWPNGTYLFRPDVYGNSIVGYSNVSTYLEGGATWVLPWIAGEEPGGQTQCIQVNGCSNVYFYGSGTIMGQNPDNAGESPHYGILIQDSSGESGTPSTRVGVVNTYSAAGGLTFVGFQGKPVFCATGGAATGLVLRGLTFGQGGAGNAVTVDGPWTDVSMQDITITANSNDFNTGQGESVICSSSSGERLNWTVENVISNGWANMNISTGSWSNLYMNQVKMICPGPTVLAPALNVDAASISNSLWVDCVFDSSAGSDQSGNNNPYGIGSSIGSGTWSNVTILNCTCKRGAWAQNAAIYLNTTSATISNCLVNGTSNNYPAGSSGVYASGFTVEN